MVAAAVCEDCVLTVIAEFAVVAETAPVGREDPKTKPETVWVAPVEPVAPVNPMKAVVAWVPLDPSNPARLPFRYSVYVSIWRLILTVS